MRTESAFGSSALATPANAVTIMRLLISPVLLVIIASGGESWPAVAGWILLTSTDGIDGYLARRHGTTSSGAFLDPLADKVLVLGALAALVVRGDLWWLPAVLIGVREISVSLYRSWLAQRGISVPARWWAKVKTVLTEVAIGFALLPLTADIRWWYSSLIWVAVALTLVTGAQYFLEGGRRARAS
ncbi:MAG TPA: CDP-diacylglycerol--glycerol-3-phosphate 3-phosphatidyltransferase [Acidimicrobiales bacterium]|nr:CDP-diacylglycerol--glycerol-3-phosphate 3-phosphatidyltransferase [Acidimicrobiales bacterium]